MKNYLLIYLTIFQFFQILNASTDSLSKEFILPAGTPVLLALNESLDARFVEIGHTVDLLVYNPVKIKGAMVIPAGMEAIGRIRSVRNPCVGICTYHESELTIVVERVNLQNGQVIYLRGLPFTKKGNAYLREPAFVKIGTLLRARILNNERIKGLENNEH